MPLTVLIVEDDVVTVELLRKIVLHRDPRAAVESASNGLDALERIEKVRPDLVFLDYRMPRLDGREFLEHLRRQERRGDAFIALVSGFVDPGSEPTFRAMGVDAVLAKPIRIERIEELLDEVERRKAGRATPR